ncbi:hypothetical protein [Arcobacter sp. F2176]|uniref:hypothetical protein n=1 Tax=Arcobacter sp. F2176 TaxID=2044511 RepID=UPI00100B95C2|nr:hypothetical protein [Arcobacter sp. F2176]RXJ82644.1 hypothetical protein CRU95_00845 [Arcobacter sp. F2176]
MWQSLLIDLGITLVKNYINSTESKKDDKVLELVQTGANYLANKPNNTVSTNTAVSLKNESMRKIQG